MKTNKNTRRHRQTRPTPPRPALYVPYTPPMPRPGCELLDFCLYPGMKPTAAAITYPTAV